MYKIDKLTLISGIDIPIPELKVNIHQPTIREIAYIGEKSFYLSAQALIMTVENFLISNGESFSPEDKVALSNMSNFQLIMTMVGSDPLMRVNLLTLLTLLFPRCLIELEERFIMLIDSETKQTTLIDDNNFSVLQEIVTIVLCLNSSTTKEEFNPQGDRAAEIAEKIKRGRAKVAALNGEANKEANFLSKYISSLGIGTNTLNIKDVLDLTLYQLFDQMERFGLREAYNMSIQAKMAGAKEVEDVEWLKDIEK